MGDVAPDGDADPLELPALAVAEPPAGLEASPEGAARFIFGELARSGSGGTRLAERSVQSLLALGEPGLAASRERLETSDPATLLAAAATLLQGGTSDDRAAVAGRLRRSLPAGAATILLAALLERDPVLGAPEYLAGLLEHPTAEMRASAMRALESRLSPALLPALAERLESPRTHTRSLALELVRRIDDRSAVHLLVSRLSDPNAQVASRAAGLLALDGTAEARLLELAFGEGTWTRGRAYAVLALVEREETADRNLFAAEHVSALLTGLSDPKPIVSGASAVALARIGYRSPAAATAIWLDRDVPHLLVRFGTGAVFHSDFSALQRPALRALALLTGESLGEDGEAWRRWWSDHAGDFHARHAVIELGPGSAAELVVEFAHPDVGRWQLQGPHLGDGSPAAVIYLGDEARERLLLLLRTAGVFGPERAPTRTGEPASRQLWVRVAGQEKRFTFGDQRGADQKGSWFEPLAGALAEIVRENRWQALYDGSRFSSQREWWQAEHARWEGEIGPLERSRALKGLMLAALSRAPAGEQEALLAELAGLYAEIGVPEASDFEPLAALLARESFGPSAAQLLGCARLAGALADRRETSVPGEEPQVGAGERLLELGLERFGSAALEVLAPVLADLGPDAARRLAQDPRAPARELAGTALVSGGREEDRPAALALLDDPEPAVALAVVRALGAAPFPEARERLLGLARDSAPPLRTAALRALGRLGGPEVLDPVLVGLADPDEGVQLASAEALAELADPRGAALLASLLARGPSSPFFGPARAGLRRLGPAGVDECLRLGRSANPRTRREAALLLGEQGVAEAAPLLMTVLTDDPADERVAWELCVLSAADLRPEPDPARAWWAWWDLVVHDDPLSWLLASAERQGLAAPERAALEGEGTPQGARFLLSLVDCPLEHLAERALRLLEGWLGQEFPRVPLDGEAGAALRAELSEHVTARYGR